MAQKIYIARHGFRLNWLTTTWKSPTGLARDPPLAAFGETQAEELGQYFLNLPDDDKPTAIFSSPYYRCLQTARPVAKALGIPIYVEHGLGEWYSPVVPGSGLHPRPGSAHSLKEFFPEIDASWSTLYYPTRRGETVDEVLDRADAVCKALIPTIASRRPRDIDHSRVLLVSHAATVIAFTRSLIGNRDLPLLVGCASLTVLDRKDDASLGSVIGAYNPTKLANGDHLKEGASREWGFRDIEISKGKVVEDPGEPGSDVENDEPVGLQIQLTSNL